MPVVGTDLLIVERAGVRYKTTASEVAGLGVGGGGGATGGSQIINFGGNPGGNNIAAAVITGQSGISTSSRIKVWFQGDTTADFNAYEHMLILPSMINLTAGEIINGVGFTIYASTQLRINGNIVCHWEWS